MNLITITDEMLESAHIEESDKEILDKLRFNKNIINVESELIRELSHVGLNYVFNEIFRQADNVYYNISQLPLETLQVIAAEIRTFKQISKAIRKYYDNWDTDIYNIKLREVSNLSADILVDYIYEFASEQAECTNGGHEAYVCPYCCHLVSFSRE